MSLLLDALQRASRDKDKSSASAAPLAVEPQGPVHVPAPVSMPSSSAPQEPVAPADFPSLALEPVQPAVLTEPPASQTAQPAAAPALELAGLEWSPSTPSSPAQPAPASTPVAVMEPTAALTVEPVAPQAPPSPLPVPTASLAPAGSAEAASASVTAPVAEHPTAVPASKPARSERMAQEIRRAYAPADLGGGTRKRPPVRTLALGAIALVLAGAGTVLMGVWGDPAQLLGLAGNSTLSTVAPSGATPAAVPAATEAGATAAAPAAPEPQAPSAVALSPAVTPTPTASVSPATAANATTPVAAATVPAVSPGKARSSTSDSGQTKAPGSAPRPSTASSQPSTTTPQSLASAPVTPVVVSAAPPSTTTEVQPKPVPKPSAARSEMVLKSRGPSPVEAAYAALLEGRMEDAQQAYQAALQALPEDRDALWGLAYLAQQRGDKALARDYYRRVLRQDPGNPEASNALWALESDTMHEAPGQRAHDLVQRQPESASALAAAAAAMAQQGQWGQSAQWWARAQALEPRNPVFAYNHAVTLDRMRQYPAALQQYEQALRLAERQPTEIPLNTVRQRAQALRQAAQSSTHE